MDTRKATVSCGQSVSTGPAAGHVGAAGNVTGVCLHSEIRNSGGTLYDPWSLSYCK